MHVEKLMSARFCHEGGASCQYMSVCMDGCMYVCCYTKTESERERERERTKKVHDDATSSQLGITSRALGAGSSETSFHQKHGKRLQGSGFI